MNRVGLALILSEHSHPAPRAHPERYQRLRPVAEALNEDEFQERVTPLPTRSYSVGVLKRTHTAGHIMGLQTFSQSGCDYLDPDTYRVASSFAASCDVTWSLLSGLDEAMAGGPKTSFVIGRPPGHHAETGRAMGFCLVNHVAVAAQYALDTYSCEKVAVVDFDVHHGNGTQQIFYDRSDVLYVSTHQYPFYPGTGARDERGRGEGEGFTLNCPLPAGTGDRELLALFEQEIRRQVEAYDPDLLLVSAGFDGHRLDPLGGFALTGGGFREIAGLLRGFADNLCDGRLVSLCEGGYSPEGNLDSITNYIRGLTN